MNERYSLIFNGEVAFGNDPDEVRKKIQDLLKIDASGIERLFSGQKIHIKKGLDRAKVGHYKQIFEATGAVCSVEPDVPMKSEKRQSEKRQESSVKKISCPNCGMEQPEALTCLGCGIVFAKYHRRLEAERYGVREAGTGFPESVPAHSLQTESGKTAGGGLVRFLRAVIVIGLIAACGYFGYQKFIAGTKENVVFTSNDCGDPCQSAIVHLQMAGIEFTEYNIDSEQNLKKFRKYGSNTLPLAFINGETLVGYNQGRYQNAIDELQGKYLPESANAVVMFTTWGCGSCRLARQLFAELDIQYVEYDIAHPDGRRRYEDLAGRGVPLILIDGKRMDGFNKQAIIEALEKADLM